MAGGVSDLEKEFGKEATQSILDGVRSGDASDRITTPKAPEPEEAGGGLPDFGALNPFGNKGGAQDDAAADGAADDGYDD